MSDFQKDNCFAGSILWIEGKNTASIWLRSKYLFKGHSNPVCGFLISRNTSNRVKILV